MNIIEDIQTLSEFKKSAAKFLRQIHKTKRPMVLTVNGKPAAVIQDPAEYQLSSNEQEYWATVAALNEALADIDNHERWTPHDKAFKSVRSAVRKKRGIGK